MVKVTKNHEIYLKMVYWGPARSGKTTTLDTLWVKTKDPNNQSEVQPTGELVKINMSSGSTLYFDRGIWKSSKHSKIFYHVYTVAGQSRFSPLRKKVFAGTDAVTFVWDSQRSRTQDNIDSLRELKNLAGNTLIRKIPLLFALNKQDLPDVITPAEVEEILKQEGLWFPPEDRLSYWNPPIYETVALNNEKGRNVYQVFSEMARRAALYQVYGKGDAPLQEGPVKLSKKVPDL